MGVGGQANEWSYTAAFYSFVLEVMEFSAMHVRSFMTIDIDRLYTL